MRWKMDRYVFRRQIYRYGLILSLALILSITICTAYIGYWDQIPSSIKIRKGMDEAINLNIPVRGEITREKNLGIETFGTDETLQVDFNHKLTWKANVTDHYQMNLKLFGIIPYKTVSVEVIDNQKLIPAGLPIGIYVKAIGPFVIATDSFKSVDGTKEEPAQYVLRTGDYILSCNGDPICGKEEFLEKVKASSGNSMTLEILRQNERIKVKLEPKQDLEGNFRIGAWIRDNAQGIGTLTYIDENQYFGALGHGVNDMDTSLLMNLDKGEIYQTDIVNITKGKRGTPGELTGYIVYDNDHCLGDIYYNSVRGIYGQMKDTVDLSELSDPLPIALKQEIEIGDAQILCTVEGKPTYYDVEIVKIHMDQDNVNRGIELKVVDKRLLDVTGGIVQGMSGAPIIQNGKLIGAVTHVLVNSPTEGYGIFIEEMLP